MRKPSRYTNPDYSPGITRLKRVFAFLPTHVAGYTVWLEYYEVLQAYIAFDYKVVVDGKDTAFRVSEWKDISKRVID